jgi:hypothetical protein
LAASCGNGIGENAKKFPTRRIYCEKNIQKPAFQLDLSEAIALRKEDNDKNEDVFIIRRRLSTIERRVRNGPAFCLPTYGGQAFGQKIELPATFF